MLPILKRPRWQPDASMGDPEVGDWSAHCRWQDGIKDRIRALGFQGESIWELADAMAVEFERLESLRREGRLVIT